MKQKIVVLTALFDVMDVDSSAMPSEITKKVRDKHGKLFAGQPNEMDHAWAFLEGDDTPAWPKERIELMNRVTRRFSEDPDAMETLIHLTNLGDMKVMEICDRNDLTTSQIKWLITHVYEGNFSAMLSALQSGDFLTALESYPTDD